MPRILIVETNASADNIRRLARKTPIVNIGKYFAFTAPISVNTRSVVSRIRILPTKMTAVIITGNPKYIKSNVAAAKFYDSIKRFLQSLGIQVTTDPGEPYTSPKPADLWIAHSRGSSRIRFAPPSTIALSFGSNLEGSINHPGDPVWLEPGTYLPPKEHYIFTNKMKAGILKALLSR